MIVGTGTRLSRVQVKSTQYEYQAKHSYGSGNHRYGTFYTEEEIDFLAVYIVPLNSW